MLSVVAPENAYSDAESTAAQSDAELPDAVPATRAPILRALLVALERVLFVTGVASALYALAGRGTTGHLVTGALLMLGTLLSRWLRRRGLLQRAAGCSYALYGCAVAALAWVTGFEVGGHLLLLPLPVLIMASFSGPLAPRVLAALAVAAVFMMFEIAELDPEGDIGNPRAMRLGNRVLLLATVAWLTFYVLRERDRLEQHVVVAKASRDKERQSAAKERKSAAARLTFLTMMSHEIRTPLNAVIAFSDMLRAALTDNEEHADMAETIASSSRALLAVINDVLDFSRVDEGHLTLTPSMVELDSVVDDTLMALHATASAKGLTLCADVQLPLPCTVEVDAVRLRQVLTNLVGNALKFTEQGHVLLTVGAAKDVNGLEFAVSDTGCGIPPESLATIFEPYRQADDRLVRTHDGTGLGLAICSRIAMAMGGSLTVESELGRGSTFRLRVPLAVQGEPPRPWAGTVAVECASAVQRAALCSAVTRLGGTCVGDAAVDVLLTDDLDAAPPAEGTTVVYLTDASASPRSGRQPRLLLPARRTTLLRVLHRVTATAALSPSDSVSSGASGASGGVRPLPQLAGALEQLDVLVAEDNAVNRKVVAHMLKRLGCTFRMALNGADCVRKFSERQPDVVLMDCHMPVMDGFEATRAIRAIDKDVPILALTADAFDTARNDALASGMNDVLTKPIVAGVLANALEKVCP